MGSKQNLVLLCCIVLFLVAVPRLPYLDGGIKTLYSLFWTIAFILHLAANMRHMKMMLLAKRKKEMQRRFQMVQTNGVIRQRKKQWPEAHSVIH
ncbi:MAG: hypothetical protein WB502_15550 [Thermoactinomyces sp.]